MIDVSNVPQVAAAAIELFDMLRHPRTADKPVLLLLNKADSPVRMSREFVDASLRLDDVVATASQRITVRECSALTGAGCTEVLAWIADVKRAAETVAGGAGGGAGDSDSD